MTGHTRHRLHAELGVFHIEVGIFVATGVGNHVEFAIQMITPAVIGTAEHTGFTTFLRGHLGALVATAIVKHMDLSGLVARQHHRFGADGSGNKLARLLHL